MVEDDRLREVYREVRKRPAETHPGEEAWERLAMDELSPEEREALLDHVTICAGCAEIYRGLQEIEREARTFDPGVPRPRVVRRVAPAWYGGLAAAAVLLIGLMVTIGPHRSAPGDGPDVLRSAPAALPEPLQPVGRVDTAPARLEWRAFPGADGYRVELSCGDITWSSGRVAATALEWPAALPRDPGVTCHWKVIALAGADRRLSADVASPLVSFEIAGR